MATKLYPFSMRKHAHDLELVRNVLFNHYICNEEVSELMRHWAEDRREKLGNILLKSNGIVAWLTGEEYGLANKAISWATNFRVAANDEAQAQRMLRAAHNRPIF